MGPTAGPTFEPKARTFETLAAAMLARSARIRHLILRDNCTNFRAVDLGVSYKGAGSEKNPQSTPTERWLHADACNSWWTANSSKSAGLPSIPADRPDDYCALQNHMTAYGW